MLQQNGITWPGERFLDTDVVGTAGDPLHHWFRDIRSAANLEPNLFQGISRIDALGLHRMFCCLSVVRRSG